MRRTSGAASLEDGEGEASTIVISLPARGEEVAVGGASRRSGRVVSGEGTAGGEEGEFAGPRTPRRRSGAGGRAPEGGDEPGAMTAREEAGTVVTPRRGRAGEASGERAAAEEAGTVVTPRRRAGGRRAGEASGERAAGGGAGVETPTSARRRVVVSDNNDSDWA